MESVKRLNVSTQHLPRRGLTPGPRVRPKIFQSNRLEKVDVIQGPKVKGEPLVRVCNPAAQRKELPSRPSHEMQRRKLHWSRKLQR